MFFLILTDLGETPPEMGGIPEGKLKMRWILAISIIFTAVNAWADIVIQSQIDKGPWVKRTAIYPLKGQTVTLRVTESLGGNIRWYQIFPDISKIYKNANHPWEENAYQWVGFGKIDYHKEPLTRFKDKWEIRPLARTSDPGAGYSRFWNRYLSWFLSPDEEDGYYHKDMGSFWFQAEVERNGKTERTPGIEDSDNRGLSPKVFRVSVRDGKGYIGYLTSFFNVPGVFGSVPYQSNNYIGADCADMLIAAYGKWKGKCITKNYNVAMLVNKFPMVDEFELSQGNPDKEVKWKTGIRPGDFIAVRYAPGRQYQHIGALYKDANSNGILDARDIVLHAGPFPLDYSYLEEGPFDGHVVILRPSR